MQKSSLGFERELKIKQIREQRVWCPEYLDRLCALWLEFPKLNRQTCNFAAVVCKITGTMKLIAEQNRHHHHAHHRHHRAG